jgi:hypothetical protein
MLTADGARSRIRTLGFCLVGAAAMAGGCSNNGSYRVEWQFRNPPLQFQTGDCGLAGVSGIGIAATRSDGAQSAIAVPCALGFYDGSLDQGSWTTLALVALDASGQVKEPPDSGRLRGQTTSPVEIHAGEKAAPIPPILLPPLPQCRDGVDNDLDGRVDLDDPDCAGYREGAAECVPADGVPCPDTTL